MISDRMKDLTKNSSVIRAMFVEGKRLAKIYGEENVFDYSIGNPTIEPPPAVKQAILEELDHQSPNFLHGYTDNAGYEDVREYVASSTNKEFGTSFQSHNVVMTNGAAGALNIILKTLLNPDDEVIVFAPFFGEYKAYVGNYGGKLVVVKANTENFQIDFDALEKSFSPKTAALIVNSPNNPSGAVYNAQTYQKLAEVLEEKQKTYGRPIYLISDEPYRRIVFDGVEVPFVSKFYKNTFVANSFSKSLSLPGERIGYILANSEMDDFELIMTALSVANRVCGFVNAPSLFQRILPACMDLPANVEAYRKNRELLYDMLLDLGYTCQKPQGTFYMFPKSLIADDVAFCNAAKEYNLLIVPGSSFSCPGYFRAAFCVSSETITRSYDSFKKLAEKFRRDA